MIELLHGSLVLLSPEDWTGPNKRPLVQVAARSGLQNGGPIRFSICVDLTYVVMFVGEGATALVNRLKKKKTAEERAADAEQRRQLQVKLFEGQLSLLQSMILPT